VIYSNEEKNAIIIFSGKVARELLRRGYTIIDVKPDKKNKIKSVYVFRRENEIEKIVADIVYKDVELFLE
jgi:predicted CoA-binding protein